MKIRKKRLGIFVFYNENGCVGGYVEYLLDHIRTELEDLIIVCNGSLTSDGKEIFEKYTDQIMLRPNIGFDMGAYKEVIKKIYDECIIDEYDELLLFNDTFFGPFCSFRNIFEEMEKRAVDFWGISWHQSEYIPSHIQSYFINFGTEMIRSRHIYEFFERADTDTKNVFYIMSNIEFALTEYFEKLGFTWDTFVKKNVRVRLYASPYEFLVKDGLPILKIKSFDPSLENSSEIYKSLEYLKRHEIYELGLMEEQIQSKYQRSLKDYRNDVKEKKLPIPTSNLAEIKKFSESYSKVYIYGKGFYGHVFARYIGKERIAGFIVSDDHYDLEENEKIKVFKLSEIGDQTVGIIVALKKDTQAIRKKLRGYCNVLFLWE